MITLEEAIKELRDASDSEVRYGDTEYHYDKVMKRVEAFEMAIKALEQQPSEDCISRKAVFKIFDEACYIDGDWYVMREKIEKLPSVTRTRPKGKWIILDECANEGVYCSKCHKTVFKLEFSHTMKWRNFKYCPNCGADMRGESE